MARRNRGLTIYPHPRKPGIYQGELWYINPDDNEPARKYLKGKTKTEVRNQAEAFLKDVTERQARILARRNNPNAGKTVGNFLEEWWSAVEHNYRRSTRELYESTLRKHLRGTDFWELALDAVTAASIVAFLSGKKSNGASEYTNRRIYKLLHAAFETGVETQVFSSNPVRLPRMMKPPKRRKSVVPFSQEHEAKLLTYVEGKPEWEALVFLAFDSGCREAELLGLQKSDIDHNGGKIRIRHTLNTVGREVILEALTKTDYAFREVHVSQRTAKALRSHLKAVFEQSDFVFLDGEGRKWTRGNFHKAWTRLLKAAEVPHYRFHSARHTCATRLLRDGHYLTAVSRRLGHAKPSITLDIYSDAIPSDQEALARAFDDALARYKSKKAAAK